MPATHPAHSDQASPRGGARGHAAARLLRSAPQHARVLDRASWSIRWHHTYSEAVVCLGLVDVILTGDRPGIVTDFVKTYRFCRICDTASRLSNQLSDGPLTYPDHRRGSAMRERGPGRRGARTKSQPDQRCDERDAKHASAPLRRVRAGECRWERFLYDLKAGPAGGLGPPSRGQGHDGHRGTGPHPPGHRQFCGLRIRPGTGRCPGSPPRPPATARPDRLG